MFHRFYKLLTSPLECLEYAISRFRGIFWANCGWLFGKRITAGRNFKLSGKVRISGPGKLIVGNNVHIYGTLNSISTPYTYSENAIIEIGDHSYLNGTRLGCRERISIGRDCMIGEARIADNDGHSINVNRRNMTDSELVTKPVIIEDNVWIGGSVIILKGVRIGMNSVIGAGSVVTMSIPPNVLAAGNPCKVIKELKQ
jgi:acetyltransferase-like isoleucine patch superfamily enzyme